MRSVGEITVTMRSLRVLLLAGVSMLLFSCATSPAYVPEPQPLEPGRLPVPNVAVQIPHLGPCTDSADRTLRFNSNYPMTILVHGCNGSAGHFRALAQLYAFHGQQAACFSYDDRDSLLVSSAALIASLGDLAGHTPNRSLTVIGHSMGGLIARKAMERQRRGVWPPEDVRINLVTVSAPFAGIAAANTCGNKLLQWLSLGAVPGICRIITGDNWYEVTASSNFIRDPEPLLDSLQRYVKIVTDERNTCRRRSEDGTCLESDYTFSLAEQYQPLIDNYTQLTNVEVSAGHVEIVGYKQVAPRKLLSILQQQGMLAATPPKRWAALERLLARLY